MGSLNLAAIVFAVVFAGGAIGLELQRRLPESFTTGGPRDMTGAVVGLMTLLVALVLLVLKGFEHKRSNAKSSHLYLPWRANKISRLARKILIVLLPSTRVANRNRGWCSR
jgi:hypothetical protein